MIKKYFFTLLLTVCFSAISFGQIIITEIADPNNDQSARYVEIYNTSSNAVDLTNWSLKRWTNGSSSLSSNVVDLSPIGNLSAGSFAIIAANGTSFQNVYGMAADISAGTGGPADSNGDDQIGVFDSSDTLIDIFGVPEEDGTGTCHEFEDGRAERKGSVTAAKATWDESEWNVWADSTVNGCTTHTNSPRSAPSDFDPKAWIGTGTDPTLIINSPSEGAVIASTTSVNITFAVSNFNVAAGGTGDGYIKWKLDDVAQTDKTDTDDIALTVAPGNSYKVYMELVDNAGNPLSTPVNKTVNFSVALPCDLVLGQGVETCDAITNGVDTYTATMTFTGGNTGVTYTITSSVGTVGGDDPSNVSSGTMTITGIPEGTDAAITIKGGAGSSCDFAGTIESPVCKPFPVVERFMYTADTDLIASASWIDASTSSPANNIQVKTGDITNYYTESQYPNPMGNMVRLVGKGSDPYIGFNTTNTGVVYASFLFQVNEMENFKANTDGGYFAVFAEPEGSFKVRLWIKDDTAGTTNEGLTYQVGISNGSTGTFHSGFTANIGEPVFVVMAYDFNSHAVKLWVVPDASSFEGATAPSPNITISLAGGEVANSLGRFILRQDSTSETPTIDFDELRISTSWADVTPKGSTASVGRRNIEGFSTFPNPVSNGYLNIKTSNSSEKQVIIYSVLGKQVFTQKFEGNTKRLDISSVHSGIYIMKVIEGDKIATKKLVVE